LLKRTKWRVGLVTGRSGQNILVLALTACERGAGPIILAACGVDRGCINRALTAIIRADGATASADPSHAFSHRARRAFALALDSANAHGRCQVAVEHLLLGVLHENKSVGALVLREHGLEVSDAELAVAKFSATASSSIEARSTDVFARLVNRSVPR
jgi:ATP-dependent Clp protease ATP-binding subunit ClpA